MNLGLKSLLFVSNQAHTDLTDSNYFQTLQLLVLQHPLPASFHQQEGGVLMVLIQSKKMKSVFSYLILGFLQSADSFLLLYSLLHFLLYLVLNNLVERTGEWMPTVIGVLLRVTEQHRANTHPYLQADLLTSIMGENPIGKTNKLGEQHFSSTERRFFFIVPFFKRFIIYFFNFYHMW